MTLTDFLLARIAEDEAAARAAMTVHQRRIKNLGGGKWGAEYFEPLPADTVRRDVVCSIPEGMSSPSSSWSDAPGTAHFKRFDPARVLAQCAAYRRIVELHANWPVLVKRPIEFDPAFGAERSLPDQVAMRVSQQIAWLTQEEYRTRFGDEPPTAPMLRALASVYADHPDFDTAWELT
jgi:hypothetical protein